MTKQTFKSLAKKYVNDFSNNNLIIETNENITITYTEGFELLELVSNKLTLLGIKKGDVILTYTPLSFESVLLCWASLNNGVVFVPIDHNWPQNLLQHVITETSPKLILTDNERLSNFETSDKNIYILTTGTKKLQKDSTLFFDWLQQTETPAEKLISETSPDDLAVILYTSGSTGIPKGVMLSQRALFNSGKLVSTHFEWNSNDLFMNLGDLHSMSGLRNTCLAPLHAGASFVIANCTQRNNVLAMLELIEEKGISYIGVAPTVVRQLNILYTDKRKNQLKSIKAIMCTGGPLAKEQLQNFYENYQIPILNYYGLTETAGLCSGHSFSTFNPTDNSIGPEVGASLLVVPDSAYGEDKNIGELLVKSNNLMSGYFKQKNENARVLQNGYFHTGDIVRKREDGCFELLSRKRNIIKNIHSELIYLEEIDLALQSHPFIAEASTCSYSKTEEDEKVVAFIVLQKKPYNTIQEAINDLKKHLVNKLGKNRIPWCFYIETSLPLNTSGKIQRQKLNEKLNEYLKSKRTQYF